MDVLEEAVLRSGIAAGARILVAVSGGMDSVALLDTLAGLAGDSTKGWKLQVAHINHCLRGEESDEDERFVLAVARRYGLPAQVARVDTRHAASADKLSIETAARNLRFAELVKMLEAWPGDVIALGHTLDDQVETVLLRMIRGTGLQGLGAMNARRDRVVRPFLDIPHETLKSLVDKRGLEYREDSSNTDSRFARNSLRSEVIPQLVHRNPGVKQNLGRMARLLQDDYDLVVREAGEALLGLDLQEYRGGVTGSTGAWRSLHPSLRRHTLRLILGRVLGHLSDISEAQIDRMLKFLESADRGSHLKDQLPFGLSLALDSHRFSLGQQPQVSPASVPEVKIAIPGVTELGLNGLISATLENASELFPFLAVVGPFHALLDAESVGSQVVARGRRRGDAMHPLGSPGRKKLQDLFVDKHIPKSLRDEFPLLLSDSRILWIPGIAIDEEAAANPVTRTILHLTYQPQRWRRMIECAGPGDPLFF